MTKVKTDRKELGIYPWISTDLIKTRAEKFFELSQGELEGNRRFKKVNKARQMIMYVAYHGTNLSLKQVASYLGNRDHTTIINGREAVQDRLDTERGFRKYFKEFIDFINMDEIDKEFEHLLP